MATFTGDVGTLLGPLPTSWTMPSSCTVQILECSTCTLAFRAQSCVIGEEDGVGSANDDTGCWPPATTGAPTPRHPFLGRGFYSPGTECPTGYTDVCTARYGKKAEWDFQWILEEGETAIACCPEGYQCTNRNGNTCIMTASTDVEPVVAQTGACLGTDIGKLGTATFPDLITQTTTISDEATEISSTRTMSLLAPMFVIVYQPSDLTPTETGATETESTSTGSPTSSSTTTPDGNEDKSDGLTSGARIGIIVGSVVGGLLVCAVVAWFIWRRWRRGRKDVTPQLPLGEQSQVPIDYYKADSEMNKSHQQPSEMTADPGERFMAELPVEPSASVKPPSYNRRNS